MLCTISCHIEYFSHWKYRRNWLNSILTWRVVANETGSNIGESFHTIEGRTHLNSIWSSVEIAFFWIAFGKGKRKGLTQNEEIADFFG